MQNYIIRDSSVYEDTEATSLLYGKDCCIRIGTVRDEVYLEDFLETRYNVEVWDNGRIIPVSCIRGGLKFGGIYNYEEYTQRGFEEGGTTASTVRELQPGNQVIVAYLNGDSREGVILSAIPHAGRREVINHPNAEPNEEVEFVNKEGPSIDKYASEFNGIQKLINAKGEYRVTFRGVPTNIDVLGNAPDGSDIPKPEYDTEVGSSYYEWDETGSFTVTDNASDDLPQSIKIDKPNGTLEIESGKTLLRIDKNEESYTLVNKTTTIESSDAFTLNTKSTTIKSSDIVDMETKQFKTKGDWQEDGNKEIKGNIKQTGNTEITGNLETTGETLLAGGSHPLVYDIVLTIGQGNLGAPVISNHIFLKTVQTKAT